jgi:hypothetical protein
LSDRYRSIPQSITRLLDYQITSFIEGSFVSGRLLLLVGLAIAGVGLLMMLGLPIGRLPGDISVKRGNFSFYFPVATSIIVSIILSLILSLFRR